METSGKWFFGWVGRGGEAGWGARLLCSECQGCARDLHALCASGVYPSHLLSLKRVGSWQQE